MRPAGKRSLTTPASSARRTMGKCAHLPAIFLAALLGIGALLPQAAAAQPIPSYAQRSNGVQPRDGEETITGTISKVEGEYLEINDDRGYVDRVDFTTETSMRPSGTALRPGMRVTITGYNQGQIFDAYEIDAGTSTGISAAAGLAAVCDTGRSTSGTLRVRRTARLCATGIRCAAARLRDVSRSGIRLSAAVRSLSALGRALWRSDSLEGQAPEIDAGAFGLRLHAGLRGDQRKLRIIAEAVRHQLAHASFARAPRDLGEQLAADAVMPAIGPHLDGKFGTLTVDKRVRRTDRPSVLDGNEPDHIGSRVHER